MAASGIVFAIVFVAVIAFGCWQVYRFFTGQLSSADDSSETSDSISSVEEAVVCPSCGYDIRVTPDRCSECGTRPVNWRRYREALAKQWPSNPLIPRQPELHESVVMLVRTNDIVEAQLLTEQLLARGILARLQVADAVSVKGMHVIQRRVLIYSGDEEAAQACVNYLKHGPQSQDSAGQGLTS